MILHPIVWYFSDLVYDLLSTLSKRLTELDVSTVLTILQCMTLSFFNRKKTDTFNHHNYSCIVIPSFSVSEWSWEYVFIWMHRLWNEAAGWWSRRYERFCPQYSEHCESVEIALWCSRRWKNGYAQPKSNLSCSMHLFKKHYFPARFSISLIGFNLPLRWNLCLIPYVTLRTIKKGLKTILHTILE